MSKHCINYKYVDTYTLPYRVFMSTVNLAGYRIYFCKHCRINIWSIKNIIWMLCFSKDFISICAFWWCNLWPEVLGPTHASRFRKNQTEKNSCILQCELLGISLTYWYLWLTYVRELVHKYFTLHLHVCKYLCINVGKGFAIHTFMYICMYLCIAKPFLHTELIFQTDLSHACTELNAWALEICFDITFEFWFELMISSWISAFS